MLGAQSLASSRHDPHCGPRRSYWPRAIRCVLVSRWIFERRRTRGEMHPGASELAPRLRRWMARAGRTVSSCRAASSSNDVTTKGSRRRIAPTLPMMKGRSATVVPLATAMPSMNGRRLIPWRSFGAGMPASSSRVGTRSAVETSWPATLRASMTPPQWRMIGVRKAPSWRES